MIIFCSFTKICHLLYETTAPFIDDFLVCVPTPGVVPNDCRTNMEILWGRRTCAVPQLVTPVRNIPNANEDPYKWFGENMDMTPREAVCLMGKYSYSVKRFSSHKYYE